MRLLSKLETNICDRILKNSGSNNFLANIIDSDLKGVCIIVNRSPRSASLDFTIRNQAPTPSESEYIINKTEELSLFILQVVNLIKMLEKDGYILLLERGSNGMVSNKFGSCVSNLPSVGYNFNDQNVIDLLCEYTNKEIYSTEEFKRFCENGYVPRDEQRFKRQILITQIALGVAIFALIFNLIINIKDKPTQKVEIEKNQYEAIQSSIKNIK
ncbi:hypothetical protein [Flavobacterium sp. KBS0721]|uniref:hypothetical protein n=1 Tax=Flavobacterium sp. KBS0721 TaxID=1179672 RepID=UPI00098F9EEB|nr:hypothetical protein [Flavobacterium sp. KBS0721]QDW20647.1 hypothetical protein B0M43_0011195 [Flavobacterium sp. KBS0721]